MTGSGRLPLVGNNYLKMCRHVKLMLIASPVLHLECEST